MLSSSRAALFASLTPRFLNFSRCASWINSCTLTFPPVAKLDSSACIGGITPHFTQYPTTALDCPTCLANSACESKQSKTLWNIGFAFFTPNPL